MRADYRKAVEEQKQVITVEPEEVVGEKPKQKMEFHELLVFLLILMIVGFIGFGLGKVVAPDDQNEPYTIERSSK